MRFIEFCSIHVLYAFFWQLFGTKYIYETHTEADVTVLL